LRFPETADAPPARPPAARTEPRRRGTLEGPDAKTRHRRPATRIRGGADRERHWTSHAARNVGAGKRGETRAVLTRSAAGGSCPALVPAPAAPRRDGGRILQPEEDRCHLRGHMRRRGEATLQICPFHSRQVRRGSPVPGAAWAFPLSCRFGLAKATCYKL
jgi:hypothetical protein